MPPSEPATPDVPALAAALRAWGLRIPPQVRTPRDLLIAVKANSPRRPALLSATPGGRHAPKGGVTIGGVTYPGGQFIPGDVVAKATSRERARLDGRLPARPRAARGRARGRRRAGCPRPPGTRRRSWIASRPAR